MRNSSILTRIASVNTDKIPTFEACATGKYAVALDGQASDLQADPQPIPLVRGLPVKLGVAKGQLSMSRNIACCNEAVLPLFLGSSG